MSLYSLVVLRIRIGPYNRVATHSETLEKIRSRENFTPGIDQNSEETRPRFHWWMVSSVCSRESQYHDEKRL